MFKLRTWIILLLKIIDIQTFGQDTNDGFEKNSLKNAKKFLKYVRESRIEPGSYVVYRSVGFHRQNRLLRLLLGSKLYFHIFPKYGDYISKIISASPNTETARTISYQKQILIVVPVYGSITLAKECIESVLKATTSVKWELLVIDDASPNIDDRNIMKSFCEGLNIKFIQNDINQGFVKTVNFAFSSTIGDVLILNSDTEVYDYWLEGMVSALSDDTATVTCFSNNASIFSFKTHREWNQKATKEFSNSMNKTLNKLWLDPIEVPTSHGFCMLVSRSAINAVGFFDANSFGHGYGEENDFSMRASSLGFKNLLSPRCFVYHHGSASFGEESDTRMSAAEKILLKKWPEYPKLIREFLKDDSLGKIETHVRRERALHPTGKVVVHISHGRGGGSDLAVRNEIKNTNSPIFTNYWIKPSIFPGCISLYVVDQAGEILLHDALGYGPDQISTTLGSLEIEKFIVHHEFGFEAKFLHSMISKLKIPFEYRIHDYFTLCPFFHFVTETGEYCGEPESKECNSCITSRQVKHLTIQDWRTTRSKLLFESRSVTAPSSDVINRFKKYHSNLEIKLRTPEPNIEKRDPRNKKSKSVVLLGAYSRFKGSDNLMEILSKANDDLQFYLVGNILETSKQAIFDKLIKSNKLIVFGPYENDQAAFDLIELINPDAFLFPGKIPETYSYTLDIALLFNKPIIACEIGSIATRTPIDQLIKFPLEATPQEVAQLISKVLSDS